MLLYGYQIIMDRAVQHVVKYSRDLLIKTEISYRP